MASGNFVAIKCLVVGDHEIGKSSLIKTYIDGQFPESVESAVCDSFHCDIPIENTTYKIEIVDVPDEREEFNDIRQLAYKNADVCIACFALDNSESLEKVKNNWIKEVRRAIPGISIILCGLKRDLVSSDNILGAEELLGSLDCRKYVEVSAMNKQGQQQAFNEALKAVYKNKLRNQNPRDSKRKKKKDCIIF